jgi:hypothetical protein
MQEVLLAESNTVLNSGNAFSSHVRRIKSFTSPVELSVFFGGVGRVGSLHDNANCAMPRPGSGRTRPLPGLLTCRGGLRARGGCSDVMLYVRLLFLAECAPVLLDEEL